MDKRVITGFLLALTFGLSVVGYAQEVDLSPPLRYNHAPVLYQLSRQTGLLGTMLGAILVENTDDMDKIPPPLNHLYVIMFQYQFGYIGATLGALPGAIYRWRGDSTRKKILAGNIAIAVGSTLGSTMVVYLIGDLDYQTASLLATLGGSLLVSVPVLAGVLGNIIGDGLGVFFFTCGVPAGALIAFCKTCRYKSPPPESGTALINFRDGRMSLAVPGVYFRPDSFGRGDISQRVDLLRVRF